MSFDIVNQTKRADDDLRENKFNTSFGHEVVSIQESFGSRLWTEGRPSSAWGNAIATTTATQSTIASLDVSPACELYPLRICFSADVDTEFQVQYSTKMLDVGNSGSIYDIIFLKAGTPAIINLAGETRLPEYGNVKVVAKPISNGKAYASIYGIEVTSNA